jgi:hypothetical protein
MEMHHKLRRDPSWDPRGCNLCGQVRLHSCNAQQGSAGHVPVYSSTFPVYLQQGAHHVGITFSCCRSRHHTVFKLHTKLGARLLAGWCATHANTRSEDTNGGGLFLQWGPAANWRAASCALLRSTSSSATALSLHKLRLAHSQAFSCVPIWSALAGRAPGR